MEFIQKIAWGIIELVHWHTLLVTELGELGKNESTNYQTKILLWLGNAVLHNVLMLTN